MNEKTMNGKKVFRTALPVILTLVLIALITLTVTIVSKPDFNANITNPNGAYVKLDGYAITNEKLYLNMRYNYGITEMLAYLSKQIVTPAYYEQTLKGRDVRDDESKECLDIIFAYRTFDLGIYYLIGDFTGKLTNMMKASKNDFVNIYETNKRAAEVKVNAINTQFSTNNKEDK